MSLTPPSRPEKAMYWPSGDHDGLVMAPIPSRSIFRSMSPLSTSTMASSLSPWANTVKMNFDPSGDQSPAESIKTQRIEMRIGIRTDELTLDLTGAGIRDVELDPEKILFRQKCHPASVGAHRRRDVLMACAGRRGEEQRSGLTGSLSCPPSVGGIHSPRPLATPLTDCRS